MTVFIQVASPLCFVFAFVLFLLLFCFVFHVINIYNSGGIIHEGKESKIISQTEISFLLQCKVC